MVGKIKKIARSLVLAVPLVAAVAVPGVAHADEATYVRVSVQGALVSGYLVWDYNEGAYSGVYADNFYVRDTDCDAHSATADFWAMPIGGLTNTQGCGTTQFYDYVRITDDLSQNPIYVAACRSNFWTTVCSELEAVYR